MDRFLRCVAMGIGMLAALNAAGGPTPASSSALSNAVSVIAVGDIAQCFGQPAGNSAAAGTAAVIAREPADTPLLLLGDLVYNTGTPEEYRDCYAPTYGKFLARSFPVPGNHDYGVPGGTGYYTYLAGRAGPDRRGYYSFDLGTWHVVALNSNVDMRRGSPQEAWLRADLAAHRGTKCTLAYWHHPRFSSSGVHGDDPRSQDIWRTLHEFKADLVLAGHEHLYERFAPQDPDGRHDPETGMRQFIIGTGGAKIYGFGPASPNSEARGGAFGVVKFVLEDGRYHWQFLPVAAGEFSDSGVGACVP